MPGPVLGTDNLAMSKISLSELGLLRVYVHAHKMCRGGGESKVVKKNTTINSVICLCSVVVSTVKEVKGVRGAGKDVGVCCFSRGASRTASGRR